MKSVLFPVFVDFLKYSIIIAFKKQLDLFVNWLRTGIEPVDFDDTLEMMKIVIAGIKSREENGRVVKLDEIKV